MQEALDFLTLTDRSASDRLVNAMSSLNCRSDRQW